VESELRQTISGDLQCFFAPFRVSIHRKRDLFVHLAARLLNGFHKQRDVPVRAFNIVEWRFRRAVHPASFRPISISVI
jgi:hypothetical protein